ncbi:MAG: amino acid adenylation domain-containing protein [Lewinella sp.]
MIYLLPHTVFTSAEQFPDKIAFVCGKEQLTYGALANRVQQLAHVLREQGVKPGDRVGIYLHRSIETAVALYGILRAGAVYVPLSPKAPPERNAYVIMDCGIEVLVTHPSQHRNLQRLLGAGPQVQTIVGGRKVEDSSVAIFSWEEVAEASATDWAPPRQVETDLAYIIYTSGSTGKPKGIMHSHASGLAFARNAVARYELGPDDRFGNHAPIYFDISQLAYFGAPLVGATAIIATDAETIFPASLGQLMTRERMTVWYSVPLALSQLLNAGVTDGLDLSALRTILYAGEPLAPKYVRQLMKVCPRATIGNLYGPAETNVCTCYDIPAPPPNDDPIPIGEVWQNTDRLILDENDEPVVRGQLGELLIHATTQMLGYWNLPQRSAKAWHHQELPGQPQRKFYRTGDLVKEDENGLLHFLGRRDHQVKVRGYRVELGAVESQLLTHPAVGEAVALALTTDDEALALVAAVVLKKDQTTTEKELLTYLKELLPWYAVPETLHLLTGFPRTATDKIDRGKVKTVLG